jgi:hypothetical protein
MTPKPSKRIMANQLKNLINSAKKDDDPDLAEIEKFLQDPFYRDNLAGSRNTMAAEKWIKTWLVQKVEQILISSHLEDAGCLMERSCWKILDFNEKNKIELKYKRQYDQKKIDVLKATVEVEGRVNLDRADRVLSDPYYQANLLGTLDTQRVESDILEFMLNKMERIFQDSKKPLDIEGLGGLNLFLERESWKILNSVEKDQFENRLNTFYKHIAEELARDGNLSYAYTTMKNFRAIMNSGELQDLIDVKIQECGKRRKILKDKIRQQTQRIRKLYRAGQFRNADHRLKTLGIAFPHNREILKEKDLFKEEEACFDKKIQVLREEQIRQGYFKEAILTIRQLKKRYPGDVSDIRLSQAMLEQKMADDFLTRALEIANKTRACEYLEQMLKKYPGSPLTLESFKDDPRARNLYREVADVLEKQGRDAVNDLDGMQISAILEKRDFYVISGLMDPDAALEKNQDLLEDYEAGSRDLKKKLKALHRLSDILGNDLKENSRLEQEKCAAQILDQKWTKHIRHRPDITSQAVDDHIKACLEPILEQDTGQFAARAEKRRLELYMDLADLLKTNKQSRAEAILYFKKIKHLYPSANDVERQIQEIEQQIFLEKITREWKKAMDTLVPVPGQPGPQLYRLDDSLLSFLNTLIKEGMQIYPGLNELKEKKKLLDQEIGARAAVERLKEEFSRLLSRDTPSFFPKKELMDLAQRASDYLRGEYPGYNPFEDLKKIIHDKVRDHLILELETGFTSKTFYRALEKALELEKYFGIDAVPSSLSRSCIEKILVQAGEESGRAQKMFIIAEYGEADKYAQKALGICEDDPVALQVKANLDKRQQGLGYIKKAEQILVGKEQENDLDTALKLANKAVEINRNGILNKLKNLGFKYDTPEFLLQEIKNRFGVGERFTLSLKGNSCYEVFLKKEICIGTPYDPKSDIQVSGGNIKKEHARIARENKTFFIFPHNGTTRVNGCEIKGKHLLKPGQTIQMGETFAFEVRALHNSSLVLEELVEIGEQKLLPDLDGFILMETCLDIGMDKKTCHIFSSHDNSCGRLLHKDRHLIFMGKNNSPRRVSGIFDETEDTWPQITT